MGIRLSKRMASFFVRQKIIEKNDKEVYEYGLQLLLSTVLNAVIALILRFKCAEFVKNKILL